jgi:hypothetical protein
VQDHSNQPLTPPDQPEALTPELLVKQWQPAVDLADVAMLECVIDEAVYHLSRVLRQLPMTSRDAEKAREFLSQFS